MSVPILLVTGFLGSGKTTLINALLQGDHGLRIAAIVNDFGAINIDEALLESATDEVIGLKNGCICCSLQGDLLRTLKQVLAGSAGPDLIVIEASGVADPQGVIDALMDPVLWPAVLLDGVVCLVDAEDVVASPERRADPLWQAQVRAADIALLTKTEGAKSDDVSKLRLQLNAMGKRRVYDANEDARAVGALLGFGASSPRQTGRAAVQSDARFATLEWQSKNPVPMEAFQRVIATLAPVLLRAKGFVCFAKDPGAQMVFQLVCQRATLAPRTQAGEGCSLVLIGEKEVFDVQAARAALDGLVGEQAR